MIAKKLQFAFGRSLGMSCFLAYFFLILFKHSTTLLASEPLAIVLFGLILVVPFVLIAFASDIFDRIGTARLSLGACILCVAGAALLELQLAPLLSLLGGILAVIGSILFIFVWGTVLSFYGHSERAMILPALFLLGAAITAIIVALHDIASLIAVIALPIISTFHFYTTKSEVTAFSYTNLKESRNAYRFSVRVLFTTGLTGFCWGIGFFLLMFLAEPLSYPLYFTVPVVLGCIVLLVDYFNKKKIQEQSLLRMFAIVAIIPIAILPFVPPWIALLCGAVMLGYFAINTILNIMAIAETARFNQINPYWVFGISLAYYFGGCVISFSLFNWAFNNAGNVAEITVCLGSVFLIVWCSHFIFKDSYPGKNANLDISKAAESLIRNERRPAFWQKKIDYIVAKYGLTVRQQEVFRILVRGRNAQFIAQEFYISYSTAKAHIHNIYAKLDVHSQQELIDLVEKAPVEPDSEA